MGEMPADSSQSAILFPGQGSQTAEMRELVERHQHHLLDLALTELDTDPFARVDEGTEYAQPAIYCAALAAWYRAGCPDGRFFAGHSLGELTALAAAGAVDPADGLRLTIWRGRLMAETAALTPEGAMVAMLGDAEVARSIAGERGLTVANDNSPKQLVLSGAGPALAGAITDAKERGLRAVRLPVQGAFHSPAMADARSAFRAALDRVEFGEPRVPVFSSTAARPFDQVRDQLADALVRPVRWRETLLELRRLGVSRYLETGPGKVLTGLVRRTLGDEVEASTLDQLEAVGA